MIYAVINPLKTKISSRSGPILLRKLLHKVLKPISGPTATTTTVDKGLTCPPCCFGRQITTKSGLCYNFYFSLQIKTFKILNNFSTPHKENMVSVSDTLPNVVFVLGGPGAGKGTQCSKIVETYGFVHLSAGDLLREERNKPGSEYGELIEKHIRDGTIVPVEITCSLIERAMTKSNSTLFLIDGFPRNRNNLDGWESAMEDKVNVLFVLFFDAPEEICVERCLGRGQAGSGRSDDNPESLKKRVNTYVNDTMPIVNYFFEKNLVNKVNAALGPDQVFEEVRTVFDPILKPAS